MKKQLEQVKLFNLEGGQNISDSPTWISKEDFHKQLELIKEETKELEDAYTNNDPIEVLDAMVDIAYVFLGMVCRFGFNEELVKAFEIVHQNNMTKIFDSEGNKILKLKEIVGSDGTIHKKIAKPEGYKPVDLRSDFKYLENLTK